MFGAVHAGPPDRPLVGAGLKMYLGYDESVRYLWSLAQRADEFAAVDVFVLPSFPALPQAQLAFAGLPVAYGAQDVHWEEGGAFTGCVSPSVLRELGCRYAEVGHAERRRHFGEDDAMVGRKAAAAARCGLVPIVCVGEHQPGNDAVEYVRAQAHGALDAIPEDAEMVIAYEPVWAIGGRAVAGGDRISAVVAALREATRARAGRVRILYGGSVAPGQTRGLRATGIDGVFVGRGALVIDDLRQVAHELAEAG
jgi:L-erythrulose 1-phosphate isomerase